MSCVTLGTTQLAGQSAPSLPNLSRLPRQGGTQGHVTTSLKALRSPAVRNLVHFLSPRTPQMYLITSSFYPWPRGYVLKNLGS